MKNDTVHVNPHIIQYTVYITNNYTGDSIVKENVTETHYIYNIQDDDICPTYRISAWNAGGEGELSEPVQESSPRGKQVTEELSELIRLCRSLQQLELLFSFLPSITVPNSVAAENISLTLEPSVVRIHIDVSSCPFTS